MAKRSPVAKKKSSRKTSKKTSKKVPKKAKTKIRRDPHKEFQERLKKQGIAEVSRLSNDECVSNIPGRVSTGCVALDRELRNPGEPPEWRGIPLSRITEIYGPPHIGKSTLLDQIFGQVQKLGGAAILADTETSRDRYYSAKLLDPEALHYLEFAPEKRSIENVLKVVGETIKLWREFDLPVVIGWDALGSTATEDELEKGIVSEKSHKPGAAAKAMALAQRLVAPLLSGTKIAFIILNHQYDVINTGGGGFGKSKETYGGHSTKHMASLRIQLYNGGKYIKRTDGWVMGREVVAKLVKNRLGDALKEARIPMLTGVGTENMYTVLEDLKKRGVITQSGSWNAINIDGMSLSFQGWNGLRVKCVEIPELEEKLVNLHNYVMNDTGSGNEEV